MHQKKEKLNAQNWLFVCMQTQAECRFICMSQPQWSQVIRVGIRNGAIIRNERKHLTSSEPSALTARAGFKLRAVLAAALAIFEAKLIWRHDLSSWLN